MQKDMFDNLTDTVDELAKARGIENPYDFYEMFQQFYEDTMGKDATRPLYGDAEAASDKMWSGYHLTLSVSLKGCITL